MICVKLYTNDKIELNQFKYNLAEDVMKFNYQAF